MCGIDTAVSRRPASPNDTRTTLALRSALRNPGRAFVVVAADTHGGRQWPEHWRLEHGR
jgi:hypothetical protein